MNERMRELELESIAYADSKVPEDNRYNDIYHSIVRRMMAELVVRECAAMTRNLSPHGELAEKAVKEHFGVEE
jgi:hypothetical protein